jgi:hypothetical protein
LIKEPKCSSWAIPAEESGWTDANQLVKKGATALSAEGSFRTNLALLLKMRSSSIPLERNDMQKDNVVYNRSSAYEGADSVFYNSKTQTKGKLYIGDYCKYPKLSRISKGY